MFKRSYFLVGILMVVALHGIDSSAQEALYGGLVPLNLKQGAEPSGGTITPSPAPIKFQKGKALYKKGTVVTVTPRAKSGYKFAGFSDPNCGNMANYQVCKITMDAEKEVQSNFFKTKVWKLTIKNAAAVNAGVVTPNVKGMNCGAGTCLYDDGTVVTLTAKPLAASFEFAGWSDTHCSGNIKGPCKITMDGDKVVQPTFFKK